MQKRMMIEQDDGSLLENTLTNAVECGKDLYRYPDGTLRNGRGQITDNKQFKGTATPITTMNAHDMHEKRKAKFDSAREDAYMRRFGQTPAEAHAERAMSQHKLATSDDAGLQAYTTRASMYLDRLAGLLADDVHASGQRTQVNIQINTRPAHEDELA